MNQREIRRLAMLLLVLYAGVSLWSSVVGGLIAVKGFPPVWWCVYVLIPLVVFGLLVWAALRPPEWVQRLFGPRSLEGADLAACAAIRVVCLEKAVVFLCAFVMSVAKRQVVVGLDIRSDSVNLGTLAIIYCFYPLLYMPAFFAAPAIARWIVGQVDSGVMWWSRLFKYFQPDP